MSAQDGVFVYEWEKTPGHAISENKAFLAKEADCV
jgi:hypothetical protein